MANRKKVKEGTASESKPANVTSNIEENKEGNPQVKVPTMEDYENSVKNSEAVEKLKEEIQAPEKATQSSESQEEISDNGETPENPESDDKKPKLHVLADDRLNSLINRANELGITDVIQILNSDKFGQFYLVYRE